jgi:hypothetical protein
LFHENESNVKGTKFSPVENVCAEVGLGFRGDSPFKDGGEMGFLEEKGQVGLLGSDLDRMENGGPVGEVFLVGLKFVDVSGLPEIGLRLEWQERALIPTIGGSICHLRICLLIPARVRLQ